MTAVSGLGHTMPYLVPDSWPDAFWIATGIAGAVVFVELWAIAFVRARYMTVLTGRVPDRARRRYRPRCRDLDWWGLKCVLPSLCSACQHLAHLVSLRRTLSAAAPRRAGTVVFFKPLGEDNEHQGKGAQRKFRPSSEPC
jgi:hypothetical protein